MGPGVFEFPDFTLGVTPPVGARAVPADSVEVGYRGAYRPIDSRPIGLWVTRDDYRGVNRPPHSAESRAVLGVVVPGFRPPEDRSPRGNGEGVTVRTDSGADGDDGAVLGTAWRDRFAVAARRRLMAAAVRP